MCGLDLIGVEKSFGKKEAVRGIDMHLESGVYGLLGENGAGKTTLMRMLCGILKPTGGQVLWDGIEIRQLGGAYRKLLGYLPQEFGYYRDFTARRFLSYLAALKALPDDYAKDRIEKLLELVGLSEAAEQRLKTYSGGMLRRVGIAQALLNEPRILVLDEPTAGLDPKERVRFRNIISSLGKDRLVILSTHIVTDVDYIADKICIMKDGKMIQSGAQEELVKRVEGVVWKCLADPEQVDWLNERFIVSNLRHHGEQDELRIVSDEKPTGDAVALQPALEDAYLYYTQNGR